MTSSLQLGVLLGRELQPYSAPSLDDGVFEQQGVFRSALPTPLVKIHDLVGECKDECAPDLVDTVLLEEYDAPAIVGLELHEDAVMRRFPQIVHRLHEVGHRGILGEHKANMLSPLQVIENKR